MAELRKIRTAPRPGTRFTRAQARAAAKAVTEERKAREAAEAAAKRQAHK
jgi:hypothetical protein